MINKKYKIALFDTKSYDKIWFDKLIQEEDSPFFEEFEIKYFDSKLDSTTVELAKGCQGVCAFVNDDVNSQVIERLQELEIGVLAMRCAGYSNVDFKAAYGKVNVVRVPAYSPYAVAEFAMGLLLTLNRKLHKAYNRTREFNFNISGLTGMDLYGKTVGVIGTGKIGRIFIDICTGFGMHVIAYDLFPAKDVDFQYVELEELFEKSDIISLHCPLTEQTKYIVNEAALSKMKSHTIIINTSRGTLIDSQALLDALQQKKIGGAGLDVYEEEADLFFEDHSLQGINDNTLALLTAMPNVLLTSHQAFLTEEALQNIAQITLQNFVNYFTGQSLENEVCYHCMGGTKNESCNSAMNGRCF